MPRVRRGTKARARHKKTLKLAKGNVGGRRKQYRQARETVEKGLTYAYRDRRVRKREFRSLWIIRLNAAARLAGLTYAYRDRRVRKREFRSLWIVRINAAARLVGLTYRQLIHGLKKGGIAMDRKVLAELAVRDPSGFNAIAELAKAQLAA